MRFEDIGGWPGVLGRLIAREDLSAGEVGCALGEVLSGDATDAQIAAFVTALRSKGETVQEMAGLVATMLEHAETLDVDFELLDTCGTGGDRSHSINVSTIAAILAAAAGAKVCKHGGRAASSDAGSADVLEALGVVIDLGPKGVASCIEQVGMGFCFAPRYHRAMRYAASVRRELGVATVFNFLGPLANPARARYQVVGVSDPGMAEKMIGVLAANGSKRAMVVHGAGGLDELSTLGPSKAIYLDELGSIDHFVIDAAELGLKRVGLDAIRGGSAEENAEFILRVLAGEPGPHRDIAVLNAGAALYIAGMADDIAAGVSLACSVIDEGKAQRTLEELARLSKEVAPG
ncbi:MAG: anthranilate phosphoribosyltransferase [Actinobacteria bacterium]|nr:anthranilate phosphoribosyltransferase [Actinomycetota bacterium]